MAIKKESELLKLLNSRAVWNLPPHHEPVMEGEYKRRAEMALDAHTRANRSDPFARGRMGLYLRRGLELPSDVLDEANGRLRAGS